MPVYIDDACGSLYIDAYAFPVDLRILEPGEVCYVPAETVAAWDSARAAWEDAQAGMRSLLAQRRKRAKAEVLAFGRAQDARRIEQREQHRAGIRTGVEQMLGEIEQ